MLCIMSPFINRCIPGETTEHSLGVVNRSLKLLIERMIRQLHEVRIRDIAVVIGIIKESFDYLIDEYGVVLVDYVSKNDLSSRALVSDKISNTNIIPSEIWYDHNPLKTHEMYSWYMVSDLVDDSVSIISVFPIGIIMTLMIWSFIKDAKSYMKETEKTKELSCG